LEKLGSHSRRQNISRLSISFMSFVTVLKINCSILVHLYLSLCVQTDKHFVHIYISGL
jgi:hypothetical protein